MLDWKRVREARKLSQARVAEHLGTTQQQFGRWEESLMRYVPKPVLRRLADLLGTSFDELYTPGGSVALKALREDTREDRRAAGSVGLRLPGREPDPWFPVTAEVLEEVREFVTGFDPYGRGRPEEALHLFPTTDGRLVMANARNLLGISLDRDRAADSGEDELVRLVLRDGEEHTVAALVLADMAERLEFQTMDPRYGKLGSGWLRVIDSGEREMFFSVPAIAYVVFPLADVLDALAEYDDDLETDYRAEHEGEFEEIMAAEPSALAEKRPRGRPRKRGEVERRQ